MSDLKQRVLAAKGGTPARLLPLYNAWRLRQGSNYAFSPEAIQLAVDVLARRERTFEHMRSGPSAGGHCVRQSVISFNGYKSSDPDDCVLQNKFDGGNFGHLRWQMFMYDMGVLIEAEVPMAIPKYGVVGTCDGLVSIPTGAWYDPDMMRKDVLDAIAEGKPCWRGVLEIKEMASYRFGRNRAEGQPEKKVRWQGDLYAECARRVDPDIEGCCYWFENKDTNVVHEFDLAPLPQNLRAFKKFYGEVMDNVEAGTLPPRPFEPGSFECNGCFYSTHCDRFDKKGKLTIVPAKGATRGKFEGEKV